MVRNTDGLMRSARSRSEDAMQRATAAILLMQAEEMDINFRSVAAVAATRPAGRRSENSIAKTNGERWRSSGSGLPRQSGWKWVIDPP